MAKARKKKASKPPTKRELKALAKMAALEAEVMARKLERQQ